MKNKLLLTLIASALVPIATTARAGHRTFPEVPTKQNESPGWQAGVLKEPVKSVLDNYLKIQSALAKESTVGIGFNASQIARVVRSDSTHTFPAKMAKQAEILAGARNLSSELEAFKPLSKSLIQYLHDHNISAGYTEVYCPKAKASWLQKGDKIDNPYLGGSMRGCETIRHKPHTSRSGGQLTDGEVNVV